RPGWVVFIALVTACGHVAPPSGQCATAAQCTDPAAPFCIDNRCESSCASGTDCVDPSRRVCASDGACVGCEGQEGCGAQAPVCDATARACRGCAVDAECGGGICLEADGTCTADSDVAFVTQMGSDAGSCTRTAPCATLGYALA